MKGFPRNARLAYVGGEGRAVAVLLEENSDLEAPPTFGSALDIIPCINLFPIFIIWRLFLNFKTIILV